MNRFVIANSISSNTPTTKLIARASLPVPLYSRHPACQDRDPVEERRDREEQKARYTNTQENDLADVE